ncbi:hypothetical protein HGRIS_014247 [Hohenbuehelia grisea]|uniref:Poly(A) RNA polymerase mitochondrial-like central palm domain-containing protein n=1 Tax=Hohenbuehelia grisea TaxID=104357 RepID=A0ABR3JUZ0_9AGAR
MQIVRRLSTTIRTLKQSLFKPYVPPLNKTRQTILRKMQKREEPKFHDTIQRDARSMIKRFFNPHEYCDLRYSERGKLATALRKLGNVGVRDCSMYTYGLDMYGSDVEFVVVDRDYPAGVPDGASMPAIYSPATVAETLMRHGYTGSFINPPVDTPKPPGQSSPTGKSITPPPVRDLSTPWPEFSPRIKGGFQPPTILQVENFQKTFRFRLILPHPTNLALYHYLATSLKAPLYKNLLAAVFIWTRSLQMTEISNVALAMMVIAFNQHNRVMNNPHKPKILLPTLPGGKPYEGSWVTFDYQQPPEAQWRRKQIWIDSKPETISHAGPRTETINRVLHDFMRFWGEGGSVTRHQYLSVSNALETPLKKRDGSYTRYNRTPRPGKRYRIARYPYSLTNEYRRTDIINADPNNPLQQPTWWQRQRFVVQDPFLPTRNLADTVSPETAHLFFYYTALAGAGLARELPLFAVYGRDCMLPNEEANPFQGLGVGLGDALIIDRDEPPHPYGDPDDDPPYRYDDPDDDPPYRYDDPDDDLPYRDDDPPHRYEEAPPPRERAPHVRFDSEERHQRDDPPYRDDDLPHRYEEAPPTPPPCEGAPPPRERAPHLRFDSEERHQRDDPPYRDDDPPHRYEEAPPIPPPRERAPHLRFDSEERHQRDDPPYRDDDPPHRYEEAPPTPPPRERAPHLRFDSEERHQRNSNSNLQSRHGGGPSSNVGARQFGNALRGVQAQRNSEAGPSNPRSNSQPLRNFHSSSELSAVHSAPSVKGMSPEVMKRRYDTLFRVQNAIKSAFGREYRVEIFGSALYGVTSAKSDLDMVIIDPRRMDGFSPRVRLQDMPRVYNVRAVARALIKAGFRSVVPIPGANVPIVKFHDPKTMIDCDININDQLGLLNSRMIKAYCDASPLLRAMLFRIKEWAKPLNLNNPSGPGPVTFSSYAFSLMTIAFLQNRGLLPNFQEGLPPLDPRTVDGVFWVRHKAHRLKCDTRFIVPENSTPPTVGLEEILYEWFKFWSNFSFAETMVSIREGGIFARPDELLETAVRKRKEQQAALQEVDVPAPRPAPGRSDDHDWDASFDALMKEVVNNRRDADTETDFAESMREDVALELEEGEELSQALEEEDAASAIPEELNSANEAFCEASEALARLERTDNAAPIEEESRPQAWRNHMFILADPFILSKNVAQNVHKASILRFSLDCQRVCLMMDLGQTLDEVIASVKDNPKSMKGKAKKANKAKKRKGKQASSLPPPSPRKPNPQESQGL